MGLDVAVIGVKFWHLPTAVQQSLVALRKLFQTVKKFLFAGGGPGGLFAALGLLQAVEGLNVKVGARDSAWVPEVN